MRIQSRGGRRLRTAGIPSQSFYHAPVAKFATWEATGIDFFPQLHSWSRMPLWVHRWCQIKRYEDAAATATIGLRNSGAAGLGWHRKQKRRDRSRVAARFTTRRGLGSLLRPGRAASLEIMGIHARAESLGQFGESGKSRESRQSHGLEDGLPERAGGRRSRFSAAASPPPGSSRTAPSGASIGPTSGFAARRQPASCSTCAARTSWHGCHRESSSA